MILIIGPESSGSAFIGKTIAHACGIEWDGYGEIEGFEHISLPTKRGAIFPKVDFNRNHIIVTTRDTNISAKSKVQRFNRRNPAAENKRAAKILGEIIDRDNVFIWSYETMIFLGRPYFKLLYKFLGIESDYVPEIIDQNIKYFT